MKATVFPNALSRTGGAVFGIKNFQKPLAEIGWATLSRRGSFNPEDGFVGCLRQSASLPSDGIKRKIAVLSQTFNRYSL
jgi:hypothetical protein